MSKALIIYQSKTGTTKKFAEQIASYLEAKGIPTQITSTVLYSNAMLEDASHIFFGCWTSGLFFILQHPEKTWVDFAARLSAKQDAKIALFTTYKIMTGSMFKNMAAHLADKFSPPVLELKSRSETLSTDNKKAIDQFIG